MQLNFIVSEPIPLDLGAYSRQLGYTNYTLNQKINKENLNVLINPNFDIDDVMNLSTISENVVELSSENQPVPLALQRYYDRIVVKIDEANTKDPEIFSLLPRIFESKKLVIKLNNLLSSKTSLYAAYIRDQFIYMIVNSDELLNLIKLISNEITIPAMLKRAIENNRYDAINELFEYLTLATYIPCVSIITPKTQETINKLLNKYRPVDEVIKIRRSQFNWLITSWPDVFSRSDIPVSNTHFINIVIMNNRDQYLLELTPLVAGKTKLEDQNLLEELAKF